MKKLAFVISCGLLCLCFSVRADAPFMEHSTGFFAEPMPLQECLSKGQKAFSHLGITLKASTNPRNEVVGFSGDYKIVLYCVSDEGGCDAPEEPIANGGTVMVAGPEYAKTKSWVDKVKQQLHLN